MSGAVWTEVAGERVCLLPQPALYWERTATLLVTDTHFGKAAAFRAGAIPVPAGTTADNLARLDEALRLSGARRLVVLGDLLHAADGRVAGMVDQVTAWRATWPEMEMMVVRGNHDVHAGDPPATWRMDVVAEGWGERPFVFNHWPRESDDGYVLAGHVHPAVRLYGRGGQSERLPCFYFGERVGILPGFGDFTGTALVQPKRGERVWVVAEGEVIGVG